MNKNSDPVQYIFHCGVAGDSVPSSNMHEYNFRICSRTLRLQRSAEKSKVEPSMLL